MLRYQHRRNGARFLIKLHNLNCCTSEKKHSVRFKDVKGGLQWLHYMIPVCIS